MKKNQTRLPTLKIVGLKIRTNNKAESTSEHAKIPSVVQHYFSDKIADKIQNRKNPGITYAVYFEYENDVNGEYSYIIGEAVNSLENDLQGLNSCDIPAQNYTRFTTEPGPFPSVVINAWHQIWQMNETDLGGERLYQADFELYDERAQDCQNAILDIYIGIKG